MAFIKVQKLVRDDTGAITSGSAAIVDTHYDKSEKYHSKHTVRERLGKVLYLNEDRKSGIFLSPTRGVIAYDTVRDEFTAVPPKDPRLQGKTAAFPAPEVHTIFGDVYLLLRVLAKAKFLDVLKRTLPSSPQYQRVLCHVLHSVLRDGSRISCEDFAARSFLSTLCTDVTPQSLRDDTAFFEFLGDTRVKAAFFQNLAALMKETAPGFGSACCCMDVIPLPDASTEYPFQTLRGPEVPAIESPGRLVLIADQETGIPVWFDILPGARPNCTALSALETEVSAALGASITSWVLDSSYLSPEFISKFGASGAMTFLGRMPERQGLPTEECCLAAESLLGKGRYSFLQGGRTYLGTKTEHDVLGSKLFAYMYVDEAAAAGSFQAYLMDHEEDFEKLPDGEKDWEKVKGGFFVLLSNMDGAPKDILRQFADSLRLESAFKDTEGFLQELPPREWTNAAAVRGKVLGDILSAVALGVFHKAAEDSGLGLSVSEILGKASSQMCTLGKNGCVSIETPSRQAKELYDALGEKPVSSLNLEQFRRSAFL